MTPTKNTPQNTPQNKPCPYYGAGTEQPWRKNMKPAARRAASQPKFTGDWDDKADTVANHFNKWRVKNG